MELFYFIAQMTSPYPNEIASLNINQLMITYTKYPNNNSIIATTDMNALVIT